MIKIPKYIEVVQENKIWKMQAESEKVDCKCIAYYGLTLVVPTWLSGIFQQL
jgi:hypothetical protein